jgi:hypothetical protein
LVILTLRSIFTLKKLIAIIRLLLLAGTFAGIYVLAQPLNAQEVTHWPPQKRIPMFHPDTDSPILIADQNRTVHAFSSQWIVRDNDQALKAIFYNKWSHQTGWTLPVDIILPVLKEQARILDAFLNPDGILHIVFFSGDGNEANIYYSNAPAIDADQASAWAPPILVGEAANEVAVAALEGDDQGNLVIIYSGLLRDEGLYAVFSDDEGNSWTVPQPWSLTYGQGFPFTLQLSKGDSGLIHAVWDVRDSGGNGRQINYSNLDLATLKSSDPILLAEAPTGYGVLFPTVVEFNDNLLVAYHGPSFITTNEGVTTGPHSVMMRQSKDGGTSWSDPYKPFPQVGVNGVMSFLIDGSEDLHFLWAQRLSGNPDLHGVWHSQFLNSSWTKPEAVVSGPAVNDSIGFDSFDPFDVHALVSQGNVLLATWRMDPGLKGNGAWYSFSTLSAPELDVIPLPAVNPVSENATATTLPVQTIISTPESLSLTQQNLEVSFVNSELAAPQSPVYFILLGLSPVALLLLISFIMVVSKKVTQSRK